MLEDYIKGAQLHLLKRTIILEYSREKLERGTQEIFKAFKAAQKQKRAFNTLSDSSRTYSVLIVVKSLLVKRAFIELKCVTSFVL